MSQLDRLLTRCGDPKVGRIRETLKAYAEAVVRDEWPELGHGRGSPIPSGLFTTLSKSILAIDPSPGRQSVIYTDMLKKAETLPNRAAIACWPHRLRCRRSFGM